MPDYHYRKLYEIAEEIEYLRMGIEHQIKTNKNYLGYDVDIFEGIFGDDGLKLEDNSPKHTNILDFFDKKK